MERQKIVSRDEWTRARKELLAREKQFNKDRDALSAARRDMPWVEVAKPYSFDGPQGKVTLRDLFGDKQQLIVYHFMFDPAWEEGCKSCSFLADNFDDSVAHLAARDTAFVAVSRAPLAKLAAFEKRMAWSFPWYSSAESDFNFDFHVSFKEEDKKAGQAEYNYVKSDKPFPMSEAPGCSVFVREGDKVFHTYSTYSRGLDILLGTYNFLDLTPMGRNEKDLPYGMAWVRHHDKY